MIVPQFWAEARVHQPRVKDRAQITVRRFGWSDTSQADAETMAHQRAQAAFDQVVSGVKLPRREPKTAYNGAKGIPIREEVLQRKGDVVITRNGYGAQCLNTPDVLFADIDFDDAIRGRTVVTFMLILFGATAYAGFRLSSGKIALLLAFASLFVAYPITAFVKKIWTASRGGAEQVARRRIEMFLRHNHDWHVRLYRTPSGFRVLAMHAVFAPEDSIVTSCFAAFGVDHLYALMCRNQHCFRARVSPKPWRIGIGAHMRPRPGIWPVKPEHLEKRQAWIRHYEATAANYASCRFVEALGSDTVHPKAELVRELHDGLSQAQSGREIA
jgi:hypothetical protein